MLCHSESYFKPILAGFFWNFSRRRRVGGTILLLPDGGRSRGLLSWSHLTSIRGFIVPAGWVIVPALLRASTDGVGVPHYRQQGLHRQQGLKGQPPYTDSFHWISSDRTVGSCRGTWWLPGGNGNPSFPCGHYWPQREGWEVPLLPGGGESPSSYSPFPVNDLTSYYLEIIMDMK